PIVTFDTEEQGLAAANDTRYGLVAYVFTRDLDRALRVAEGLETGMVGVNRGVISDPAAPFGGVKESGFGREGGFEGIEEYLSTKYIALCTTSRSQPHRAPNHIALPTTSRCEPDTTRAAVRIGPRPSGVRGATCRAGLGPGGATAWRGCDPPDPAR